MILSGWVLPDFVEVHCPSLSGCKAHIEIVSKYLINMKTLDKLTYNHVMEQLQEFSRATGSTYLDDFAVFILGWIKVGDFPYKYVDASSWDFQEEIIDRYVRLGFSYTHQYLEKETFYRIDIPSAVLLK